MAFSSGGFGAAMGGGAPPVGGLSSGPDLETIQTEDLGFLSIAGDARVRLTSAWSSLPAPTASLLCIAPRKGLVAAAGPDQIVLASTAAVRKAFEAPKEDDSEVRSFDPQLKIPMPMRVSQLAFTADENYLILSAESGGALAVYEVQNLFQGSTNPAFELSTNSEPLKAMIPNPTPEKAELCAIVTDSGNLHMANLREHNISKALKDQVSCVSWSSKGKQLCAGLGDGTICQLTPDGDMRAVIPRPPGMESCRVSSLTWLENNLFLAIYSSSEQSSASCVYQLITRYSANSISFQKLTDPVDPWGANKVPHHTLLRLRDFSPSLQDLLIVSSTASAEIGLLSRSSKPLTSDKPADAVTGVFTTTELLDDTKRPTLPMSTSMDETTPIGISLDLSSRDKVYKPIPSDEELEESPGPLPGLWVLTHEGVLCSWWIVYTDSIKQGTTYAGMVGVEGSQATSAPAPVAQAQSISSFSNPSASAFGAAAATPAFGAASQMGQKPSPWGAAPSSSGPTSTGGATFGSSTFGSSAAASAPAFGKPSAFGQPSQLGMRASPWGSAGGSAPAFGQSSFANLANKSNTGVFGSGASGSTGSTAPASGGFATFANQGGFAALAANKTGSSVFASSNAPSSSPFGGNNAGSSMDTAFPPRQDKPAGSAFGSTPFKLESSFKPDASASDGGAQPFRSSGTSMFGSAFGSALNDAGNKPEVAEPSGKDEDMDVAESVEETPQSNQQTLAPTQVSPESTTPTTTPASTKFGLATSPAPGSTLFGQNIKPSNSGGLFGTKPSGSTSGGFSSFLDRRNETAKAAEEPENNIGTPKVKVEDQDAPLPPDATSKAAYPLGDSSSSSAASNAPSQPFGALTTPSKPDTIGLPSDFMQTPKPTSAAKDTLSPHDFSASSTPADAPLPPDFIKPSTAAKQTKEPEPSVPPAPLPPIQSTPSSDFIAPKAPSKEPSAIPSLPESGEEESDPEEENASEGSGVDVAKDLSPSTSGLTHTPGYTPQSSFGAPRGVTTAARQEQDRSRPLFGEISRNAPMFPRPNATSPRSPSPVRGAVPSRMLRSEASRSVSAPGMASQILGPKKSESHLGSSIVSKEKQAGGEDPFLVQHRRLKARQEAEETQPLVDEEDDEVQKILASEVDGVLELDEFIAHSNVAPPAKESIPSQVEAVYRDINAMIDTLGLNSRTVKAFIKGHTQNRKEDSRTREDLEIPDDWVLCETDELGEVLDDEMDPELKDGQVQDIEEKLEACQDLARDMQRLRAKQEDLKKTITARMDPDQADLARLLPLSAEQATQQNELRREFANFSKLLAEAEESLTLLKTRIASVSGSSGKGNTNTPTVEAVIRTISKMTTMVEKRSGDIDVLENQLRKVRLGSTSREGSPVVTPQGKRSVMFSPESTPSRNLRQSLASSVGPLARATPPRKKLSGFSKEEKSDLMERRARRQAVLGKLKESVEKGGVNVWSMEDIE